MLSTELAVGLLTFVGSALVVLPTFDPVSQRITDTRTIAQLEKARTTLLHFDSIERYSDDFFASTIEVIEKHSEKEQLHVVHKISPSSFGYGGKGGLVFLLDVDEAQRSDPFAGDWPEELESLLIVDEWLSTEINEKRTKRPQRIRYAGFACFLLVFLLRL